MSDEKRVLYSVKRILSGSDVHTVLESAAKRITEEEQIDIDKLCDKADAELKKVIKWFKDNEDAFKAQDLKLHDAAFYDFEKDYPLLKKAKDEGLFGKTWDPFDGFAEYEYDNLIDFCDSKGINFERMIKPVQGSNSKFYLDKSGRVELVGNRGKETGIRIQSTIDNLMDYLGYENSFEATEDGLVDREYVKDWYKDDEYVILNLEDIASGQFLKDIKKEYAKVLTVYDYIKDFKKNQVDHYKVWLDNETELVNDSFPEFEDAPADAVFESTEDGAYYEVVYGRTMGIVKMDRKTTDYGAVLDVLIDGLEEDHVKEPYLLSAPDAEEEYNEDEYVIGGNHGLALIHNGNFWINPITKKQAEWIRDEDKVKIYEE